MEEPKVVSAEDITEHLHRAPEGLARRHGDSLKRLVILGSDEAGLALVRDAQRRGLEALVFDTRPGVAMRSRLALAQLASQAARAGDVASLIRELRELGDPQFAALIASDDHWLVTIRSLRHSVGDAYRSVLVASDTTLDTCLDLSCFTLWCAGAGIRCLPSWRVGQEARPAALAAPFVIRAALRRPSLPTDRLPQIVLAVDEIELMAWLPRYEDAGWPVVVSASMSDRPVIHYSVGFARRDARFLGLVAERVRPFARPAALGTFMSLRDEPAILDLAKSVAEALDYFGIGEVEILHDRSTGLQYVVQVNPRPWHQYALATASGYDLLEVVSGVRGEHLPRGRGAGMHWWAPAEDIGHLLDTSPRGALGLVRTGVHLARTVGRANVYARLDWTDPLPALGHGLAQVPLEQDRTQLLTMKP